MLTHLMKADPQRGSQRLGLGTQVRAAGNGIALHMHGGEDEILYIVRGRGLGVVGRVQREVTAGSLIYIPQGAWHGVRVDEEMEVMWIVSPPHFAMHLREWQAQGGKVSEAGQAIARKHQLYEADEFLRRMLRSSEWHAADRWGRVHFDSTGLAGVYNAAAGPGGTLQIVDYSPDGLGFKGTWSETEGESGEFLLYYDFASGTLMRLKWSSGFKKESLLRRVP